MINRKAYRFFFPVIAVAMIFFFLFSCEKEEDMVASVTVKYLSDTNIRVEGAQVIIEKNDVRVEGVTDVSGQFSHTFDLEAILDVHVHKDTGAIDSPVVFYGSTVVRLIPDKTVRRTVYISP